MVQEPIKLESLTAEQLAQLSQQLEAKKKEEADLKASEIANYKSLVDVSVNSCFPIVQEASLKLSEVKTFVFDTFKTLIQMKAELYGRKEDQFTHTFTSADGSISIQLGRNIADGWDDTVNTGIAKVNDFILSMGKDDNSKALVSGILRLLAKDKSGMLKASRVLDLKKMADDTGDKGFIEAVKIIQDAYKPSASKEFIKLTYKDGKGAKIIMPLSISEVGMLETEEAKEQAPVEQ